MNPFEMVITIIFIVFACKAFQYYLQHKESLSKKQSTVEAEGLAAKLENQEKTIQSLRKRIEALESIVVRDEYELNRKFKEL